MACLDVAAGVSDIVLAVGVDKFGDARRAATKDGLESLSPTRMVPAVRYALIGERYRRRHGVAPDVFAQVAVKNHGNAALNPNAQFRKVRTLEQVLGSPKIVGDLTALQCCPRGEGAAAAIVVSETGLRRLQSDRAVRVASSVSISEAPAPAGGEAHVDIVRKSTAMALAYGGFAPKDLDLVELHDAFSVEELLYSEAMGLAGEGEGARYLIEGRSAIGGDCAINSSGGLIGMGHPIGPTGLGQVHEIVTQLRGEAGPRQHRSPRVGLAHLVGLGAVAVAHVITRT
jgi:acetyl-CoA acetyltransferase